MSVPSCPRNAQGQLTCSKHTRIDNCMSLHYGLHQPCKMAEGWLTCLDMEAKPKYETYCQNNYGVHKDLAWVQDGCSAAFTACYITDVNRDNPRYRTMECRDPDGNYKQCRVDGAQVVDDVVLKHEIPSRAKCAKGINFGIFKDSIWIHGGCNGIFNVTYFEEPSKPVVTKPPPIPATTKPTARTTKQSTTTTPVSNMTTKDSPFPFHSATSRTSTYQTTTFHAVDTPSRSTDSFVPIALAIAMGALVVILLIVFIAIWLCRRNSTMKRYMHERPEDNKHNRELDDMSNHYEEIAPVLNPPGYDKTQETDPFLARTDQSVKHNNCRSEPNNNPPLPPPNNYFILEPHTPDPPTPRNSIIVPGRCYYPLDTTPPPPFLENMSVQPYAHVPVGSDIESLPGHAPSAPPMADVDSDRIPWSSHMRYIAQPEAQISFQTFHPSSAFVPIRTFNRCSTFPMNNLNHSPSTTGSDGYEISTSRRDRDSVHSDKCDKKRSSSVKSSTMSTPSSDLYYPNVHQSNC